jgi:flagellar hook-associated protein 1 FlgK
MSITSALSHALSGLSAAARSGEVISTNVANAMTEGFARREVEHSSVNLGGYGAGVRVVGTTRVVNTAALADRRIATADHAAAQTRAGALARIEDVVGTDGGRNSIPGRIAALDEALIAAASRPDSTTRLGLVLTAASDLAGTLKSATDTVQKTRADADASIARDVGTLNDTLARIRDLNTEITAIRAEGRDANALFDQRQALVDRLAEIVPLREVPRRYDQIALFSEAGATLLDGKASVFGFTAAGTVVADMSIGAGSLSGLTLNGRPVVAADGGLMAGGRLASAFDVRDSIAPAAQTELDALARDLYERFATSSVDATLAPGAPGLLTDAGAAFSTMNEVGLAGRLKINAAADPAQGGALWRIRDGLGAATQGNVGDSTLLARLSGALADTRVPASGAQAGLSTTASALSASVLSGISAARLGADDLATFAATRRDQMDKLVQQDGVDSDDELRKLLLVEQTYSANAQVMRTMDELLRQLMGVLA